MSTRDELIGELRTIPTLPGARCRGRWELFDATIVGIRGVSPDVVDYARNAALRLCAQCPALAGCCAWFHSLPPQERPYGVIAGQLHAGLR